MSDAKKVRAELKKRIQAVNNKINRTYKTSGAKVAGSEFDPRRREGIEDKYNVKQMQNYLSELNDFMRRGNQFVAGRRGAPLPRNEVFVMQARQKRAEEARKAHDEAIGGLMTPIGAPYREASEFVTVTAGASKVGPYVVYNFRPEDITSAKSLREISKKILKQTMTKYLSEHLAVDQKNAASALEYLGEKEMAEQVANLSEYQFDAFWNGTYSAELIFAKYKEAKATEKGSSKERWQDRVANEQFADVVGYLDWASTEVPTEAPTKNAKAPRNSKKRR